MKAEDLRGQLSETGLPFNSGYYISISTGDYYFAEGEELQRDLFLQERGVLTEDTPDWDSLHEEDQDSFYYSEWIVEDGMDGGYDPNGIYYLNENGVFIREN